jgi:hypothetical protein
MGEVSKLTCAAGDVPMIQPGEHMGMQRIDVNVYMWLVGRIYYYYYYLNPGLLK